MDPLDADTQPTYQPALIQTNWRWLIVLFVALGGLLLSVGLLLLDVPETTLAVQILIDGEETRLTTHAETVADLLAEQNIVLETDDRLNPVADTLLVDGMMIEVKRARTVWLTVDGQTNILRTTRENPLDILRLAQQEVRSSDRILIDGTETDISRLIVWPVPVSNIVIERTASVTVQDGGDTRQINTTADTVGDLFYEAGITLFLADTVTPDLSAPLSDGMTITIDRSHPLTVIVDGSRLEARVNAGIVADALVEMGVTLSGLDYTIPAEETDILPGMSVRVIRVTEQFETEQNVTDFETVYQADAELPLDERRVIQAGQQGVVERSIRVRFENGIEINREVESENQISEVRNRIVAYGTRVVLRTVDTPEGPREYWRKLRVYATSYKPESVGGSTTTSIGYTLEKGVIGINPDIIPYRTPLYVRGYGVGVSADTGGPRSNPYWIDLGYSDSDWRSWSSWVDVYLLTPVPDTITYLLPATAQGGPLP
jgi:resuscitation-promoting factor RpfB